MIMKTTATNLRELNKSFSKIKSKYRVEYVGFYPSSGIGIQHYTRHYVYTYEKYSLDVMFEIEFNSDTEEFVERM